MLRASDAEYYSYEMPIEIVRGEIAHYVIYLNPRPRAMNLINDASKLNPEEKHDETSGQIASPGNAVKEQASDTLPK